MSDGFLLPLCERVFLFARGDVRLHSMLVNCGHEIRQRGENYRWSGLERGNRELFIWQYTLAGCGRLKVGQEIMPVRPHEAMLLLVPEDHCYWLPDDEEKWEFFYISLNGATVMSLARELRRRCGALGVFPPESPAVTTAVALIREELEKKISDPFRASALAYSFMMALWESSETAAVAGRRPDFLPHIRQYCLDNLHRPLTVGELAQEAGCSRWHFSRLFREAEGESPGEFIEKLRMRLAVQLLQTSRDPVKVIAARCGYRDISYFCRAFRRRNGCSPAAFRLGR